MQQRALLLLQNEAMQFIHKKKLLQIWVSLQFLTQKRGEKVWVFVIGGKGEPAKLQEADIWRQVYEGKQSIKRVLKMRVSRVIL